MSKNANNAVGQLLYGATPIGEFIGLAPGQVAYLAHNNRIPHFKLGKKICSTSQLLSDWLAQQQAEASQATIAAYKITG